MQCTVPCSSTLHANARSEGKERNVIRIWPGERWDHSAKLTNEATMACCFFLPAMGGVYLSIVLTVYIECILWVWISLINFVVVLFFRFLWNYLEMHSTRFPVVHRTRGFLEIFGVSLYLWFLLGYFFEHFFPLFFLCLRIEKVLRETYWYWRLSLVVVRKLVKLSS